jgi:predicted alpha/beta-fold hydrolase
MKDLFDIVFVNYRGLGGAKLLTPKLFCSNSWEDAAEAIEYISKNFPERKLFAIGLSMGGNILANMLGYQESKTKISAAAIIMSPLKPVDSIKDLKENFFGLYNKALGNSFRKLYREN